jgi:hypothetical protein
MSVAIFKKFLPPLPVANALQYFGNERVNDFSGLMDDTFIARKYFSGFHKCILFRHALSPESIVDPHGDPFREKHNLLIWGRNKHWGKPHVKLRWLARVEQIQQAHREFQAKSVFHRENTSPATLCPVQWTLLLP